MRDVEVKCSNVAVVKASHTFILRLLRPAKWLGKQSYIRAYDIIAEPEPNILEYLNKYVKETMTIQKHMLCYIHQISLSFIKIMRMIVACLAKRSANHSQSLSCMLNYLACSVNKVLGLELECEKRCDTDRKTFGLKDILKCCYNKVIHM